MIQEWIDKHAKPEVRNGRRYYDRYGEGFTDALDLIFSTSGDAKEAHKALHKARGQDAKD